MRRRSWFKPRVTFMSRSSKLTVSRTKLRITSRRLLRWSLRWRSLERRIKSLRTRWIQCRLCLRQAGLCTSCRIDRAACVIKMWRLKGRTRACRVSESMTLLIQSKMWRRCERRINSLLCRISSCWRSLKDYRAHRRAKRSWFSTCKARRILSCKRCNTKSSKASLPRIWLRLRRWQLLSSRVEIKKSKSKSIKRRQEWLKHSQVWKKMLTSQSPHKLLILSTWASLLLCVRKTSVARLRNTSSAQMKQLAYRLRRKSKTYLHECSYKTKTRRL